LNAIQALSQLSYNPMREKASIGTGPQSQAVSANFFPRLCHRKWLMFFSLKFQRNNRQNTLALYSAKKKTGEKRLYFHRTIEMKQLHTMIEPFPKQLISSREPAILGENACPTAGLCQECRS
ncbi:hypothetical protein, partial [Bilophila sp.]|uniref:hypothetical protein n=1 Tax=Bilophila sp. TaxID=1929485 RepID=UPI0030782717